MKASQCGMLEISISEAGMQEVRSSLCIEWLRWDEKNLGIIFEKF